MTDASAHVLKTPAESKLQIMVVEDHAGVRDSVEAMVESWRDADITSVEDFYAARHWIEKLERLDLLLCDVSLPGEMSGLDVAAMALSAHPAAAIVLFSADPRSDLEGMLDRYSFLQKPFGRDQLLARIDDAFIRVNKQALVAPANQP